MKLLNDNKGQIRIIEAFFASVLILSSLALIPSETHVVNSNTQVLRSTATNVLTSLDSDGFLSKLIENSNWTTLRKCVESILSPSIWFNLTVFNDNMQKLNDIQICSGNPVGQTIVSTEYLCASVSRDYTIYIIRLQLSTVS
jgi:hypothetical protein